MIDVFVTQRPPLGRQPRDHGQLEFLVEAERDLIARVIGEDRERELRRTVSVVSPVEPARRVAPQV